MNPKVSIVIVSMNKLSNLEICLPSIRKFTKTPHKIYVVAYMFTPENLKVLHDNYSYVEIIESNEIRGFSENNNLALKKVDTPLVFILNDDTEFKEPVLDKLVSSLEMTPEATVMSPVIYNGDGKLLYSGRRKETFFSFVVRLLINYRKTNSKYENGKGIFRSYDLSGAAFLIYTEAFRQIGFFNEKYFFCPEDVEVGHLLNEKGQLCYVDADCNIIHYEGVSSKKGKLFYATTITAFLGNSYFYGNNLFRRNILLLMWKYKYLQHYISFVLRKTQHHKDYMYIYNEVYSCYKNKRATKDVFIQEYKKVI